jgi:hypothetical protein
MRSARERFVKYLELHVESPHAERIGGAYNLRQLLLETQEPEYGQRRPRSSAREVTRLRHVAAFDFDNVPHLAMLFAVVNLDAFDESYENPHTAETITHPKQPDFGNRREAHVVVRLEPRRSHHPNAVMYPVGLEESQGLPPSEIQSRLSGILGNLGRRDIALADGSNVVVRPGVRLNGQLRRDIFARLARDGVEGFTLVKELPQFNGLDQEATVVERQAQLNLDVVGEMRPGWWERVFGRAKAIAQERQYTAIKVHYYDARTSKYQTTTVDVVGDNYDAAEQQQIVTRGGRIDLREPMHHNHATVVLPFVELMARKLRDDFDE